MALVSLVYNAKYASCSEKKVWYKLKKRPVYDVDKLRIFSSIALWDLPIALNPWKLAVALCQQMLFDLAILDSYTFILLLRQLRGTGVHDSGTVACAYKKPPAEIAF